MTAQSYLRSPTVWFDQRSPLHRLDVSLHAINAPCDASDERERLRVLCEYRRKHAWDNASELSIGPAPYGFHLSIRRISDWHVHCPLKRRTLSRHLNCVNFEVQVLEPFSFLTFPFLLPRKTLENRRVLAANWWRVFLRIRKETISARQPLPRSRFSSQESSR